MTITESAPPCTHVAGIGLPGLQPSLSFLILCGAYSSVFISEEELSHKTAVEMEAMNVCIPCLHMALLNRSRR